MLKGLLLVVAMLILSAPVALAQTQTDCTTAYEICHANCLSSGFDCYYNNPPSAYPLCRVATAICDEVCLQEYQNCRFQQPYLTEDGDGEAEQ